MSSNVIHLPPPHLQRPGPEGLGFFELDATTM